jgi:hypothetical protein
VVVGSVALSAPVKKNFDLTSFWRAMASDRDSKYITPANLTGFHRLFFPDRFNKLILTRLQMETKLP